MVVVVPGETTDIIGEMQIEADLREGGEAELNIRCPVYFYIHA
jgi:hypothetical protein